MSSDNKEKSTEFESVYERFISLCDQVSAFLNKFKTRFEFNITPEQALQFVKVERDIIGVRREILYYVRDGVDGLKEARTQLKELEAKLSSPADTEAFSQLTNAQSAAQADFDKWATHPQNINRINSGISEANNIMQLAQALERESRANEMIRQASQLDFESKKEVFQEACKFHNRQAVILSAVIFLLVICTMFALYFFFIKASLQPTTSIKAPSPENQKEWISILERMILVGVGRFALLIFCGWAIKYLADLYRAHSEQAIIYRDRMAALGVAQTLLNIAPELKQKEGLLRDLANGYLDFKKSAFRIRYRRRKNSAGSSLSLTEQMKKLKDTMDAIRPVVESLKGLISVKENDFSKKESDSSTSEKDKDNVARKEK